MLKFRNLSGTRILLLILIIGIISLLCFLYVIERSETKMNSINPTENFIVNNMVNHNGTFATYLKENDELDSDLVKGKESISESLGLWLQYTVKKKDEELFRQGYLQLEGNFMNDEGLIYWKLDPSGRNLLRPLLQSRIYV